MAVLGVDEYRKIFRMLFKFKLRHDRDVQPSKVCDKAFELLLTLSHHIKHYRVGINRNLTGALCMQPKTDGYLYLEIEADLTTCPYCMSIMETQ